MRTLLIALVILLSSTSYAQTHLNSSVPLYELPQVQVSFGDYVNEHFEAGAGLHALFIIPGGHLKLRYAPINHNRIKVLGEIRGEAFLAPFGGWNYNVQLGTTFLDNIGLHAGIGRSHYIGGIRKDDTQPFNRLLFNTFEIGINTFVGNRRFDVFTSIPLSIDRFPLIVSGISWSIGEVWYLRPNQGLFGRKKSRF